MKIAQKLDVAKFTFPVGIKKEVGRTLIAPFCSDLKRKNIPYSLVVENPVYKDYREAVKNTRYGWWSTQNLSHKGFELENPLRTSKDDILNIYVITSKKALKKFDNQFQSVKGIFRYGVDMFKSILDCKKFTRMTRENPGDIHYSAATNVLYFGKINEYQNKRFQKCLKKLNILEWLCQEEK